MEVVVKLLERGADINAKDSEDCTALYRATANGHWEVVVKLLQADSTHCHEALNSLMKDVENHLNSLPKDTIIHLQKLNNKDDFCKLIPVALEDDPVFSQYICPINHAPSLNLVQIIENGKEFFF